MTEKKTSAAQLRAAQKYKRAKVKRITVDFSPAESDLWEQVSKQPNKQGYIKRLIRADMAKNTPKMCICCNHSMSGDAPDGSQVLVCFDRAGYEGKEMIVGCDVCCPNYTEYV